MSYYGMMGGLLHKNMKKKRLYNIRKLVMEKRRMKEEEEMQDLNVCLDDITYNFIDNYFTKENALTNLKQQTNYYSQMNGFEMMSIKKSNSRSLFTPEKLENNEINKMKTCENTALNFLQNENFETIEHDTKSNN